MEENKEDIIKYHQNKRRKHKIRLSVATILLFVIGVTLICSYYIFNKQEYIYLKENSKVDYGVNLKENEFYEETYLDEGMDVISSLIKNIDAEFKYDLDLTEEIRLKYDYKILAEVEVKEKAKSNLIYKKSYELVNKPSQEVKDKKIDVVEKINIDYNKYNDEVKKLLNIYDLDNTLSELNITLYLNAVNQSSGEKINTKNSVAGITIPLATNTVELTVNENVKNYQGEILKVGLEYKILEYAFGIGFILILISLITLVKLLRYVSDTRSAEKMYDDELKKIQFDYKAYIQKINNIIDYNEYKIVNVDTFREILQMREELQSPILMYNEENTRRTTFLIINQNILFQYILDSNLIREKLIKLSKEKKEKKNGKNK